MALQFSPLYWIYHDGWNYRQTKTLLDTDDQGNIIRIDKSKTFYQMGHCHLFLMDVNPEANAGSGQAYWGKQTYRFHLEDEWGPNSKDPSQAKSVKLIGKPIWYFTIEEYWRRFYIQPWETNDPGFKNGLHDGKTGIKYDASKPQHSLGPFREGGELYFFDTVVNRTMPVEYWRDANRQTRDYYIKRQREGEETSGGQTWSYPIDDQFFIWVEDTHYEPMAAGNYGEVTHRKPNLVNVANYSYNWQGMNAKRIKTDKYIQYACDSGGVWSGRNDKVVESHERVTTDESGAIVVDDTVDWEGHPKFRKHSQYNQYPNYDRYGRDKYWSGWYEYGEIVQCNGKWYRREWHPYGYSINNFDPQVTPCWTTSKRRHFPNPPPWLCDQAGNESNSESESYSGSYESAECERITMLHWEYFLYFDRVRHYDGNGSPIVRSEYNADGVWAPIEEWEDRRERYRDENGIGQNEELSLDDENSCFAEYIGELGNSFFKKWMDGIDPATGKVVVATGLEGQMPGGGIPLTYVTFSDFRKIWRELSEGELQRWNFYGDAPRRNETPLPDTLHSAFYPRAMPLDANGNAPPLNPQQQLLDESQNFPVSSPYDPFRGGEVDPVEEWKKYFTKRETFTIPDGTTAQGDGNVTSWKGSPYKPLPHPREQSFSAEDGARRQYPDDWFVSPIIEYQRVMQLDNERLPQYQGEEEYINENWNRRGAPGSWGDGFDVSVSIPFSKNGQAQSPFSDDSGQVQPIGVYCHGVVRDEDRLKYHVERLDSIDQLRKWDFPQYVDFVHQFARLYPNYREDLDDPDATQAMLAKTRRDDPTVPDGFNTWGEARDDFWKNSYSSPTKNRPVTRRSDENQYAGNGVWRAQTTHLLVGEDKIDENGQPRPVQWNNPYPEHSDGQWMEQCLGAKVTAKIKLILEDALGHRFVKWVENSYAMTPDESQTLQGLDHDAKKND